MQKDWRRRGIRSQRRPGDCAPARRSHGAARQRPPCAGSNLAGRAPSMPMRALALQPKMPRRWSSAARIARDGGDLRRARDDFETALKLAPDQKPVTRRGAISRRWMPRPKRYNPAHAGAKKKAARHSASTVISRHPVRCHEVRRGRRIRRAAAIAPAPIPPRRAPGAKHPSASVCGLDASAASLLLPMAISTLRTKRSRPMRLTGDLRNKARKPASSSRASSARRGAFNSGHAPAI